MNSTCSAGDSDKDTGNGNAPAPGLGPTRMSRPHRPVTQPRHHRVVVTGAGYVTPLGCGADLATCFRDDSPPFTPSPTLQGAACCPVTGFDAAESTGHWRHRRYLSRGALFALASALLAAQDAGWDATAPDGTALVTAHGPNLDITADFPRCGRHDTARGAKNDGAAGRDHAGLDHPDLDALWLLRWLPNTAASAIAQRLGIHGEGLVVGTACAAGLQALGEAFRRVRHGLAPAALVAGGDSRLSAGGMLGYARADALWRRSKGAVTQDDARCAMRPFDTARRGFVPGEGGAALVLETEESARERGARILGEVLGFAATLDGGSLTAPDSEARHAERAVRDAVADAGLTPEAITWVAAHGTSTPRGDAAEAGLLRRVFADAGHPPAVTALKSWTGHLASACGLVECALMLHAARAGVLPPVRNLSTPCVDGVDFVRGSRPFPDGPGIIESFGFGGQNAALVMMPYPT